MLNMEIILLVVGSCSKKIKSTEAVNVPVCFQFKQRVNKDKFLYHCQHQISKLNDTNGIQTIKKKTL